MPEDKSTSAGQNGVPNNNSVDIGADPAPSAPIVTPQSASGTSVPPASTNPGAPAPAPAADKGPKMVTVSEDALKELQAQIIALNKKVNETADRGRLQDFNSKQNKKVTPICRISYFRDTKGDRLIMGWGNMVANKAKYGKNFEQVDQRTILFLKDASGKDGIVALEVDYISFFQNKFQEEVEIIGKTELSDGRVIFKVLREDGEEIEMDSRFVN